MDRMIILAAIVGGSMLVGACDQDTNLDPDAVARGKKIASSCATCHSLTSESNRVGPHLVSVLGRKAGTLPGYEYSEAMKRYGQEWTPERMAAFLEDPLRAVPGTKMGISPLSPEQARDIVGYIRSLD